MITKIIEKLKKLFRKAITDLLSNDQLLEDNKIISAKCLSELIASRGPLLDLHDAEYKVFSQFGEDGIIEYLIRQIGIPSSSKSFIELGVETYSESNTRFLLQNRNWRGVVVDNNHVYMEKLRSSRLGWLYDINPISAFITVENINSIILKNGLAGEIGLLSIDLDGNDYWIWNEIDVVSPIIVIVEYNSVFGAHLPISVPYDPLFIRQKKHYSNLYWGASIAAFSVLGKRKGYSLVGSNSAGNNAFFVRDDCLKKLHVMHPEEAWIDSCFRESRNESNDLTYLKGDDRRKIIEHLDVVNVITGDRSTLKSLGQA